MAGQAPNSSNINLVASGIASGTSIVVHPEYQYWRPEWRKLRDVLAGQREVKRARDLYLRPMKGQDSEDYDIYLDRATFYNMTGQTLNGMIGQVFYRDPIVIGLPDKFKSPLRLSFGKDGSSHTSFCKAVVNEQIGLGRYGVLVDAPATSAKVPTSYVVGYAAENIMDWTIDEIGGVYQLSRVLLREFAREAIPSNSPQNPWIDGQDVRVARNQARAKFVRPVTRYTDAYTYSTIYRELCLEQQDDGTYVYTQYIYNEDTATEPAQTIVPTLRGQPLDFIPFQFFGATGNTPDVEKSPLLDIADLNISHYRTYAELEYGRLFTALPVYYAPGKDDDGAAEYHIGPNIVWEVPVGSEPGILEYKGEGLNALVTALNGKERQIAAIGGRLLAGAEKQGSESVGQTMLREANEQALILNVVQATEPGMAQIVRWWLMWRDVPLSQTEDLEYNLNRDFVSSKTGAREIRALQMLHEDGYVPIEILYNVLIKVEWLDPTTTLEEFQASLDDPKSFPNNPDAQARQRGFASRQQELDQTTVAREADMQQEEIDLAERQVIMQENAPPPVITAPKAAAPAGKGPRRPSGPKPSRPNGRAGK